ncbi:TPA: hypothetical protein DCL37_00920 [Candidatus Acetothermia bacterium]|nr:hypothetical protein [Candidatus Acetothermia bacterium]
MRSPRGQPGGGGHPDPGGVGGPPGGGARRPAGELALRNPPCFHIEGPKAPKASLLLLRKRVFAF